jgi:hypothetical protein
MAGFQLEGPAANASKILYGESHKLYQSPNEQYNFEDIVLFVWAPHTICDFYGTKFSTHLQPDLPAEIRPSG